MSSITFKKFLKEAKLNRPNVRVNIASVKISTYGNGIKLSELIKSLKQGKKGFAGAMVETEFEYDYGGTEVCAVVLNVWEYRKETNQEFLNRAKHMWQDHKANCYIGKPFGPEVGDAKCEHDIPLKRRSK